MKEIPQIRQDSELPPCIKFWGWKYHHLGIPTNKKMTNERYLPQFKFYVSGFSKSPFGVEWMRFEKDSPIDKFVQIDDENIIMVLGVCEFKDIIFRINKGIPYIAKKYGISYITEFITLDCIPVTTDNKFVFGLRYNNTNVNSVAVLV